MEGASNQPYIYKLETPMVVIAEEDFVALDAIPRSNVAKEKELLIDVNALRKRRKNCLLIYISHRWLKPKAITPHPDNHRKEKFRLIRSALRVLRGQIGKEPAVFLWCDYFGIDQDDNDLKIKGIMSLPAYIERSDMLLTPIASNSNYTLTQISQIEKRSKERGYQFVRKLNFSATFAKDLAKFHHTEELFSRGWIRLEEYLGSNVPLNGELSFEYFKRIKSHRRDRPHLFCTETMFGKEDKYVLISLPRLSRGVLQTLNPLDVENSELTVESDRSNIAEIMRIAGFDKEEYSKPIKDMYEGDLNEAGEKHGRGILNYADGDIYEGGFAHGLRHGHGMYYYANGDKFEGTWNNGIRDESRPFIASTASGEVITKRVDFIKKAKKIGMRIISGI